VIAMKRIVLLYFCFIISSLSLFSQVSLSPEIGLNYHPSYHRDGGLVVDTVKSPSFYIGILGELSVSERISFQLRFNYIFRRNTRRVNFAHLPAHSHNEFTNMELVTTFDVFYALNQSIKIGVGPGIIHKLNSRVTEIWTTGNRSFPIFPRSLISANMVLYYELDRIGIGIRYFYAFGKTNDLISFNITSAKQGLALGVNYKFFDF